MSSFRCTSCKSPNASNARFCTNCGATMIKADSSPYDSPTSTGGGAMVAEYAFAGFWKRFIAYIIDSILFTTMFAVLVFVLGGSIATFDTNSPESMIGAMGIYLFYYPAWWLYFAFMESSSAQATFGKKAMGIKVTDRNGHALSFGHATGRHCSAFITQLTFTIGYLMAAFTARKQALHDMVAGTLVVNKRYGSDQVKVASENPGSGMSVGGIIVVVFLVLLIPVGGIIAAVAIPAYQDYTMRSHVQQAINETNTIRTSIVEYAADSGYWPNTLQKAGIEEGQFNTANYQIILSQEGSYEIVFKQPEALSQGRLMYTPEINSSGNYDWNCIGQDISKNFIPPECR